LAAPTQIVEPPRGLGRSHRLDPDPLEKRVKPPRIQKPRRKVAGKAALTILVLLSAITGTLAGLTLVYSSDLPQI